MNLLGALPARFRRERVLIVGCGDVGLRVASRLGARVRLLALTSSPARVEPLRAAGLTPLLGDLDAPSTLFRLAGLATRVLHLAPPPNDRPGAWHADPRTQGLLQVLARRAAPAALVYASTSGVYGDCGGRWVDESAAVRPMTGRAWRRADAEARVRAFGRATASRVSVLRIPGIYAPNRARGTPEERLRRGTPALRAEDDVYTNHIHADDLARACLRALWLGRPQRAVNVSDDSELRMGDYLDAAADLYGLPRPPRVGRDEAQGTLPLSLLSFMGESRRLRNTRMKRELRLNLAHPHPLQGLRAGMAPGAGVQPPAPVTAPRSSTAV